MEIITQNAFIVGIGLTVILFLFNIVTGMSAHNVTKNRLTCIFNAITFGLICYGTYDFFGPPQLWWHTAIALLAGMMALGALLEARKKLPLAPRVMQQLAEDE